MSTTAQKIVELTKMLGSSLTGDARYWDLRRTYGDNSTEVLRHLRECVDYRRSAGLDLEPS